MNKNRLLILALLSTNFVFGQFDTSLYHKDCLIVKKNSGKRKDALDVRADRFLERDQILVYFYFEKSDTVDILLNGSLFQRKYVNVSRDRTGDNPDFSIKVDVKNKTAILTVYFETNKSFFRMKVDKKYKVYGVVYHTGVWPNCIYVEKKKYFRFK